MPMHSMFRSQNTLYTSNVDVGSSQKPVVASTITIQHHTGSDLPPKPQNPPPNCTGLRPKSVRLDPYGHSHHIKLPNHIVYIQYGCGVQSEACCGLYYLYHEITTSRAQDYPLKHSKIHPQPTEAYHCMGGPMCPSTA